MRRNANVDFWVADFYDTWMVGREHLPITIKIVYFRHGLHSEVDAGAQNVSQAIPHESPDVELVVQEAGRDSLAIAPDVLLPIH